MLVGASVSTSSLLKPMYPHTSGPSRTNRTRALVALPTQATLAPLPCLTPLPQAIRNTLRRLYYHCYPVEIHCLNLPHLSTANLLRPIASILYLIGWTSPAMLRPVIHLCLEPHLLLLMHSDPSLTQLSITVKLYLGSQFTNVPLCPLSLFCVCGLRATVRTVVHDNYLHYWSSFEMVHSWRSGQRTCNCVAMVYSGTWHPDWGCWLYKESNKAATLSGRYFSNLRCHGHITVTSLACHLTSSAVQLMPWKIWVIFVAKCNE